MSLSDEKWQRREARMRGSGTRALQIDDFSINLPESPKQERLLKTLDSALVKPEDHNRPRLRQNIPRLQPTPHTRKISSQTVSSLRQKNRKLMFSSDEDDDEKEEGKELGFGSQQPEIQVKHEPKQDPKGTLEPDLFYEAPDFDLNADDTPADYKVDEEIDSNTPTVEKKTQSPKKLKREASKTTLLSQNDAKRRRGRPTKEEREEKDFTVQRRSRRIVDNPALRQAHVPDPKKTFTNPKPLRVSALASLLPHRFGNIKENNEEKALSLTAKPNGKQKGMSVDAERVYTASTRSRRSHINTLDVLLQLVEEHTPRPTANELVSENRVLTEFKTFLRYNLMALMDQHATILDITQDITDVQRRKNDVRRSILDLKKKHAAVGTELAKERKSFADSKAEHSEFMAMANSLKKLKAAVLEPNDPETVSENTPENTSGGTLAGLSELLPDRLDEVSRMIHPTKGLWAQLQNINTRLAELISKH